MLSSYIGSAGRSLGAPLLEGKDGEAKLGCCVPGGERKEALPLVVLILPMVVSDCRSGGAGLDPITGCGLRRIISSFIGP